MTAAGKRGAAFLGRMLRCSNGFIPPHKNDPRLGAMKRQHWGWGWGDGGRVGEGTGS